MTCRVPVRVMGTQRPRRHPVHRQPKVRHQIECIVLSMATNSWAFDQLAVVQ